MSDLQNKEVEFKIAHPESLSIIGSNSVNTAGDLYVINLNSIAEISNRRLKILLDILISLILLISLPFSATDVDGNLFWLRADGSVVRDNPGGNPQIIAVGAEGSALAVDREQFSHLINNRLHDAGITLHQEEIKDIKKR